MKSGADTSASDDRNAFGPPALALSAGGARGAYQVGCLRAFEERDLSFAAVAGSSIGALNGAFFIQNLHESAERFWKDLTRSRILSGGDSRTGALPARLASDIALLLAPVPGVRAARLIKYALFTAKLFSKYGAVGSLGRDGFMRIESLQPLIDRRLDIAEILKSPVPLFVTVYKAPELKNPRGRSLWFRLQDHDEKDAARILAASMSLPFFFGPVEMKGTAYLDGGLTQWLPIKPLVQSGFRNIIAVALKPGYAVDPREYPGRRVTVIAPESRLGRFPLATFRFTEKAVSKWMAMGYRDACRVLDANPLALEGRSETPVKP